MMRVAILTASRHGTASQCLPALARHPDIDVAMVVRTQRQYRNRWRKLRRDFEKISRIGPLGAAVGYHMRSWYAGPPSEDLEELAGRHGVRYEESPLANGKETVALLEEAGADLGLSLGNGYIFPRVYRTPRLGMINIHGEVLPEFRGAASVIWPIYEGVCETGLTVHQIDDRIDTGAILYQERFPIEFADTLAETVKRNVAEIARRVPGAVTHVVTHYEELLHSTAAPQSEGRSYTTPTFAQYRRMLRQHRILSSQQGR